MARLPYITGAKTDSEQPLPHSLGTYASRESARQSTVGFVNGCSQTEPSASETSLATRTGGMMTSPLSDIWSCVMLRLLSGSLEGGLNGECGRKAAGRSWPQTVRLLLWKYGGRRTSGSGRALGSVSPRLL
jgi:hypothetical protein